LIGEENSVRATQENENPSCSRMYKPVLVLPFVSDKLSRQIKSMSSTICPNPPFHISFKSELSFKSLCRSEVEKRIRHEPDDVRKLNGVVYKLNCLKCQQEGSHASYVGETGRVLDKRLKEHFSNSPINFNSIGVSSLSHVKLHAINKHEVNNSENWGVEILSKCEATQRRRVLESMAIREHKPNLNANNGLSLII
jgi:hypothetical protein